MNFPNRYPLKLRPIYKEKIWGGRNLARLLHKRLPPGLPIGESWEVSNDSTVADGPLTGKRLAELVVKYGPAIVGTGVAKRYGSIFPLLIKFIDAQDKLSIQVHPDDDQAQRLEGVPFGKTEMWYVLDARKGGEIIHGIDAPGPADQIAQLVREGGLVEKLHREEVTAGDVIFIPAGTVHAMGEGLVICEVQQNCDVTYRLYDWNRVPTDAQPRALHVDKAIGVARSGPRQHKTIPITVAGDFGQRSVLAACRYFSVDVLDLQGPFRSETTRDRFTALVCLAGEGEVAADDGIITLRAGESALVPAICAAFELHPRRSWRLLRAWVPDLLAEVVQPLLQEGVDRLQILQLGGDIEHNDLATLI